MDVHLGMSKGACGLKCSAVLMLWGFSTCGDCRHSVEVPRLSEPWGAATSPWLQQRTPHGTGNGVSEVVESVGGRCGHRVPLLEATAF
jgi:hypothetical protein